jgi:phenylalanine-4-hydroxylase
MYILVRKPEGKRPLRRHRCKFKDKMRMDFKDVGWEGVDWIHLDQDRDWWQPLFNTVMNLWIPLACKEFLDQLSYY